MERKISKKNKKYMNSKGSKKNSIYTKPKISKKYKIKGGKPFMNYTEYTYFINAHGGIHENLPPITIARNSSIITLNKIGFPGSSSEATALLDFYSSGNRLFERNDQSKKISHNGQDFIDKIKKNNDIMNDMLPADKKMDIFSKVRNHIYGDKGFMNDINITFLPQKIEETDYLGVYRVNHSNNRVEFFDKYLLLKLQRFYESYNQSLTFSKLLKFLFGVNDNKPIIFDQPTTIISFMCREFDPRIPDAEMKLMRTRSSESDTVPSIDNLFPLIISDGSELSKIDQNRWLGINTIIRLHNGITGKITGFNLKIPQTYPLGSQLIPYLPYEQFKVELDDPTKKLCINSCVILKNRDNHTENDNAGTISNIFDISTGLWPVRLFDGTQLHVAASDMELSPFTIGSAVILKYEEGDKIQIKDLIARTDLNGKETFLTETFTTQDRVGTTMDKSFKLENIELIEKKRENPYIYQVTGFDSVSKLWNIIYSIKAQGIQQINVKHLLLLPYKIQKNTLVQYEGKIVQETIPRTEIVKKYYYQNVSIGKVGDYDLTTKTFNIIDFNKYSELRSNNITIDVGIEFQTDKKNKGVCEGFKNNYDSPPTEKLIHYMDIIPLNTDTRDNFTSNELCISVFTTIKYCYKDFFLNPLAGTSTSSLLDMIHRFYTDFIDYITVDQRRELTSIEIALNKQKQREQDLMRLFLLSSNTESLQGEI